MTVSVNEPDDLPSPFAGADPWEDDSPVVTPADDVDDDTPSETVLDEDKTEEAEETEEVVEEAKPDDDDLETELADKKAEEEAEATKKDEEEAEAAKKDEEDKKDTPRIPKSRFDAVNERMKRAEAALREKEAETKAAAAAEKGNFDFDAKEEAYMDAVLDGDKALAKSIRAEIRAAEQATFEGTVQSTTSKTSEQVKAELALDTAIATLEAAHEPFNPNSEAFDKELVDEVLDWQQTFMARGFTPADALNRAARYLVPDLATEAAPVAKTTEEEPAKPAPKKEVDVKAKAKAAGQQPPDNKAAGTGGMNEGAGVVTPAELSEDEFDALPESKKRELRGDVV